MLDAALAAGRGAVLVTPHFGSWDLGGAWLAGHGYPLVTVVEQLRPRRLLEWFLEVRRQHGITVLVRGPGVRDQLVAALERRGVARTAPEQWHLMVPNWPSDRTSRRTRPASTTCPWVT